MTPNERRLENDIRETVGRIYSPMQRQASDAAALVSIAMFLATVALWVSIVAN